MKLYDIVGQYLALYEMIDEDTDAQTIQDTIEATGLDEDLEAKADGYAKLIKQITAEAAALKAEADNFYKRAKARENIAANLAKNLYNGMAAIGVTEVPNKLFTIKIKKNGGVAPLMFIEGKDIPEEFYKVVKEVDNTKVREALKTGSLDFAKLGERGTHLEIK